MVVPITSYPYSIARIVVLVVQMTKEELVIGVS